MSYEFFFIAIQDEVWRFNRAIVAGARPTLYRYGKTYQIEYVFYESGKLWAECFALWWMGPSLKDYMALMQEETHICHYDEWKVLLQYSGVARHDFLAKEKLV